MVACNTATAAAIDFLREKYAAIPIVGMEPAVKPACLATRTGIVGVLATGEALTETCSGVRRPDTATALRC